jgi:diguanylate cyclase (GGDEF)-like protein/PAS domain S-box-containing protein
MFSFSLFRKIFGCILIVSMGSLLILCCYSPQNRTVLLLAVWIFSVSAIWLCLKTILLPITYLSEIASKILKHDFSDDRYIAGDDDIGILGAALYRLKHDVGNLLIEVSVRRQEWVNLFRKSEQMRGQIYDLTIAKKDLAEEADRVIMQMESLRKSEDRYRTMLENIEEGYYETDLLGNLIFFNDSLYNMLGYSRDEMVGMNCFGLTDDANADKLDRTLEWVYENGKAANLFDLMLFRQTGKAVYVEMSVTPIKDSDGQAMGFRGIIRDVSARRDYHEKLEYLAYHDELTGLYNRKAFFERLKDTLAQSDRDLREKHIFFMDLDKFKQVNDTLGHEAGDKLLQEVAERLRTVMRQTDHICRLGGDEFTAILNNVTEPAPEAAAQRIIEALSAPYRLNEHQVSFINISIGIATYPKDGKDITTLVNCADAAMFEAKKIGNRYVFFSDIAS